MYIKRNLSFVIVYFYTWRMVLASLVSGSVAFFVYQYLGWKWVAIPWLPVSLVGTATAFFVGFKNNQAYDRSWEARKIWGSITNTSRSITSMLKAFVSSDNAIDSNLQTKVENDIRIFVHRHIAWMYLLKKSLHNRTSWEHNDIASIRQRRALKIDDEEHHDAMMKLYLDEQDQQLIKGKNNPATQILDRQSQHLAHMRSLGLTDDLRHVELQRLITDLYNEQGKCERIKNTPFPRQYATTGTIFIMIFMILLPFGMITEFLKLGDGMLWLLIPFNIVVNWVFLLMEYTGDVSENPFEGLINDVPVFTIVRNIEIDLREMIGDTADLPEKVKPARLNVQY